MPAARRVVVARTDVHAHVIVPERSLAKNIPGDRDEVRGTGDHEQIRAAVDERIVVQPDVLHIVQDGVGLGRFVHPHEMEVFDDDVPGTGEAQHAGLAADLRALPPEDGLV